MSKTAERRARHQELRFMPGNCRRSSFSPDSTDSAWKMDSVLIRTPLLFESWQDDDRERTRPEHVRDMHLDRLTTAATHSHAAHQELLRRGQELLADVGHKHASKLHHHNPVHMQLLADMFNAAAKSHDPGFYRWKPHAVHAAIKSGATGGWSEHQGTPVFYLKTRFGVSSYHDPHGELAAVIGTNHPEWKHGWHGYPVQWSSATIAKAMTHLGERHPHVERFRKYIQPTSTMFRKD